MCHVLSPIDKPESDLHASTTLLHAMPASLRERVAIAPRLPNVCETKWLISQLDWFCGTRMHTTIAALSSNVPADRDRIQP